MLDPRFRVALLISLFLNVLLSVIMLCNRPLSAPPCWDLDVRADYYMPASKLALPQFRPQSSETNIRRARLTNIVMPFHARQEAAVIRNLELWRHFPPCDPELQSANSTDEPFFVRDEHPAGRLAHNVTLTFFVSGETDPELELRLLAAFTSLPPRISQCFTTANVRFSRLTNNDDSYLTGSRKMFEFMLNGWLGMTQPYYVLYMEPDCLPVRPGWLTVLDALTRHPTAPFWIKGSIFRGDSRVITNRLVYNLFHINGNALYNLGDPAFRHFYFDLVRPFIATYYNEGAYDTDIFKFLLDLGNWNYARSVSHMFQFTDSIQNHWHSNYSISELKAMSGTVALVHGGTPSS